MRNASEQLSSAVGRVVAGRSRRAPVVVAVGIAALALPTVSAAGPSFASAGASAGAGNGPAPAAPVRAEHTVARDGSRGSGEPVVATAPKGPNPYLALLPEPSEADYAGWNRVLTGRAEDRRARLTDPRRRQRLPGPAAGEPAPVDEDEPPGAFTNDTFDGAQYLDDLGSGRRDNARVRLRGELSPPGDGPVAVAPNGEDDGSIPLARRTSIDAVGDAITTTGAIGDGPHGVGGTGTGDFDFYRVEGRAGAEIVVEVNGEPGFNSMAALWDAEGNRVAFNDNRLPTLHPWLAYPVPADGTYYAMVSGFPAGPSDPFDSGSGGGAGAQGGYTVTIGLNPPDDVDVYAVDLRPGDVLAASVTGSAEHAALYDPAGHEVQGSGHDLSALYSPASPLPGGGNAVVEHVASVAGRHYLELDTGLGAYEAAVEVYRSTAESDRRAQTLFLDFDGERINTAMFGGPGVRELSPFRAWLGRWGLTRADEEAVARQVIETVEQNIRQDLKGSGLAGRIRLVVKNSYDHRDPFGEPNVSRVVIGGSVDESGLATIGIAEHIDPGNFGHEDSALVQLDVLSDVPELPSSLNFYLTEDSDRIEFVGRALGNVVAHEAGHFLGNWHTEQFNEQDNLMDAGGNFAAMFGVGPDGIGGTTDDTDVDFGQDAFNIAEGFTGTEDTLNRTAFGLGGPRPLQ